MNAMGLGYAARAARLAEAYLLAGRAGEALERARSAVDLSRKQHERANEAVGLRVLAEIAARSDPLDEKRAEELYASSLALANELGMRPLVAHCHLGIGQLLGRTGGRDLARTHLSAAVASYKEMGLTYWLKRATAETTRLA
jgi:tetratricopeptide (TPR) repeat protein